MLAIQERGFRCRDEELRAIGVLAGVGHGQHALGVLDVEVLVVELAAIDGLATGPIAFVKIAALDHKVADDAVEGGPLVAKTFLARSCNNPISV